MGKIEKLIVLGVLFLITIILVVTFSTEDPVQAGFTPDDQFAEVEEDLDKVLGTRPSRIDRERTNPGDLALRDPKSPEEQPLSGGEGSGSGNRDESALVSPNDSPLPGPRDQGPQGPTGTQGPATDGDAGTALLSTGVTLDKPVEKETSRKPTLMKLPDGAALLTTEGLANSFLEDFKLYTWESGDTYRALAARYYGDANRSSLLRQYNEDRYTVEPGMQIFVPVFDVENSSGAERVATNSTGGDRASQEGAGYYVVADGESLWTIAREVYGAGSKWQKIADANKDVLPDPHDLTPGVRLRLP